MFELKYVLIYTSTQNKNKVNALYLAVWLLINSVGEYISLFLLLISDCVLILGH